MTIQKKKARIQNYEKYGKYKDIKYIDVMAWGGLMKNPSKSFPKNFMGTF
jgi:hypothetical protein